MREKIENGHMVKRGRRTMLQSLHVLEVQKRRCERNWNCIRTAPSTPIQNGYQPACWMTNLVHGDAHGQGSSQDNLQNFRLDSPSPRINASTTTFPFYYSVLCPHLPHSSFALYYLFCHFVLVKKFPFLALILIFSFHLFEWLCKYNPDITITDKGHRGLAVSDKMEQCDPSPIPFCAGRCSPWWWACSCC